jgi:hypothetical protein
LPRQLRRSVRTGLRQKQNDCSAEEFPTFEILKKGEDSRHNNQNSSNARIRVAAAAGRRRLDDVTSTTLAL